MGVELWGAVQSCWQFDSACVVVEVFKLSACAIAQYEFKAKLCSKLSINMKLMLTHSNGKIYNKKQGR